MGVRTTLIAGAIVFLLGPQQLHGQDAQPQTASDATASVRAARLTSEIRIDGRLNEEAWSNAEVTSSFTESYPNPGIPAAERTEVRILYDQSALYVGVRMYDSSPDSIAAPLARRDPAGIYSDWLHLIIDSYHDRRTAFRFSVNPRGVQRDVYTFNDGEEDASWDAVWQVATVVDDEGWTAEYRIPFSQLRYQSAGAGERVWGLQVMRDIARREQRFSWSPWNRQSPGFVSSFGELHGLAGIQTVRRLELQPYTSAKLTRAPDEPENPFYRTNASAFSAGADVKVGLTSGLTLTGTINPDFGQVELDPAVINLSAFESFFSEKRPFFVEGADVFRFGQVRSNINLQGQTFFYSRRIGRAPQRQLSHSEFGYVDSPRETSILGAAKVTGKVGPWTLGVMNAVTGQESAVYLDETGERQTASVEPRTNYFVSRLRREFNEGTTVVGSIFNATNRALNDSAFEGLLRSSGYFGGVDFEHRWAARTWSLSGYLAGSHVAGSTDAIARAQRSPARYYQRPDASHVEFDPTRTSLQGHIAEVALRRSGAWEFSAGYKESSPGFELNDMGFQGATDYRTVTGFVGRIENQPKGIFRNRSAYVFGGSEWNFGGDHLYMLTGGGGNATFKNLWSAGLEALNIGQGYDDRLTRGGPQARRPGRTEISSWFNSPARNRVSVSGNVGTSFSDSGAGGRFLSLNADWRPSEAVRVRVGPSLSMSRAAAQFITSAADVEATETFGRRYVFAEIEQTTVSMNTRLDWTFTPTLSLQLFAQPFIAAGEYEGFKEFRAPRTFEFDVYGEDRGTICRIDGVIAVAPTSQRACPSQVPGAADPDFTLRFANPDFNLRSLRGNAVMRWEYRPGSALFLVWQQQRDEFAPTGVFDLTRDIDGLFRTPSTNVFLIKATYWLGR